MHFIYLFIYLFIFLFFIIVLFFIYSCIYIHVLWLNHEYSQQSWTVSKEIIVNN